MKNLIVFDNNGNTFDRYTIIEKSTGEMIGASDNPFHPQGFGQYCGNCAWNYFTKTVGAGFMSRIEKEGPKHYKRIMRQKAAEIIKEFKQEGNIGRVIDFNQLPTAVQQFAKQSFETVPA